MREAPRNRGSVPRFIRVVKYCRASSPGKRADFLGVDPAVDVARRDKAPVGGSVLFLHRRAGVVLRELLGALRPGIVPAGVQIALRERNSPSGAVPRKRSRIRVPSM